MERISSPLASYQGNDGYEAVFQDMSDDDLTLFQTLGPCGSDIILPDDLEHAGTGLTRCGGQGENRKAKHGHDTLSEAEPEIVEGRGIALDGKPLEL